MSIDAVTGLPTLPKGYFWRVRKVGLEMYADRLYLCIMRRRWFWSLEVDRAMVSQHWVWGPTMASAIRARARHLVEDNFAKTKPDFSDLLGDYPPKSLVSFFRARWAWIPWPSEKEPSRMVFCKKPGCQASQGVDPTN